MEMKNLIVQVDIPDSNNFNQNAMHGYFKDLYETSKKEFLNYAKRFHADYLCIHTKAYDLEPSYERFQIFENKFDHYDNILYVDCDVIPKIDSPDIFHEYGGKGFAAFSEGAAFYGNNKELKDEFGIKSELEAIIKRRERKGYIKGELQYLSKDWLENIYFNNGVFLIDKKSLETLRKIDIKKYVKPFVLYDQSAMNKMIFENDIAFHHLSYKYNGMFHYLDDRMKSKVIASSYFVHFCGPMKNIYKELTKEFGCDWFCKCLNEKRLYDMVHNSAVFI